MSDSSKGRLVLWNDDKGFGFVRPDNGEKDFFLHISAIKNYRKGMSRRPELGDTVHFQPITDREAAQQRRILHATIEQMTVVAPTLHHPTSWWQTFCLKALVGAPLLLSSYVIWKNGNPLPLASYLFMSVLSILYYGFDKRNSLTNRWRIPEFYLHSFELLGGWPGALLAQNEFRHKNKKPSYQRIFWAIVALHGVGWAVYISSGISAEGAFSPRHQAQSAFNVRP